MGRYSVVYRVGVGYRVDFLWDKWLPHNGLLLKVLCLQALAMSRITWTGEGLTRTTKTMCFQWRIARTFADKRGSKTLFGCGEIDAAFAKMQSPERTQTHAACLVMHLGVPAKEAHNFQAMFSRPACVW